ncbi:polysaccharide biosynthesis C-terminal domain-containing protein [Flavobacteriaceae bacterium S0825]|uniref:oligosaccharide flippase family protein n=1 Tax=Gaetbulibacter sp. S0825 TaxID=2720084 RepID=UPI0014316F3E|nr:polysaccharide biosynthesis C-terminal domain-containing protein [Gaetbulibacter sp. S0825]MCK0109638.1 polysaccharide biosynthesis C-terminal domain-containing protein [Flavobacteriaceae bacterium S0825]NIX65271.1 oligosaccharide flippase family protein [Gaetbulibacter sp. S0825]
MGIVQNQSFKNTITTYIGFGIGAINTLFLYTEFMSEQYYGLITYILSTAYVMMPLLAFGTHNTLVKFYSAYKSRNNVNSFLTWMLFLPLLMIVPLGLVGYISFEIIGNFLSETNPIIKDYVWLIYVAAIAFSYFEVFYSWTKVHMNSVFGNFMKEVFHRAGVMILLFCLYFQVIAIETFVYAVVGVYILRMLIMKLYAFYVRRPIFRFGKLPNLKAVLKYSALIIIAGSVANIILEIDKFMIGQYIEIEKVAYYGVAIYIATVIGVPARSMHQITNPLTAKLLNEGEKDKLKVLYKKSSLNLFIISGLIFLLIILNINQLYLLIDDKYTGGLIVVLLISVAKLSDNIIGNNNAILFNSDYYRVVLALGVLLAIMTVVFNAILIPEYGINGAAFATFMSVIIYNFAKVAFVYYKFKISPFCVNTFKTLVLIVILAVVFYFWEFPFHPIINIGLKSILIGLCYGLIVYRMNFSDDIYIILNKFLKK